MTTLPFYFRLSAPEVNTKQEETYVWILRELLSWDFNLQKFYEIVTQDFHRAGGDPCVDSVKKSWNLVKTYGKTGNE